LLLGNNGKYINQKIYLISDHFLKTTTEYREWYIPTDYTSQLWCYGDK